MKDFKKNALMQETSDILNKHSVDLYDLECMAQIQTEHLVRKGIAPFMNEFVDYMPLMATSVKNGNDRVFENINDIKESYEKMITLMAENQVKMYTAHHIDDIKEDESNDLLTLQDILSDHKPPYEPIIISMNERNTDDVKFEWNYGFTIMKNRDAVCGISVIDKVHYFDCECEECLPKGEK